MEPSTDEAEAVPAAGEPTPGDGSRPAPPLDEQPRLRRRVWNRLVYLIWEQMLQTQHPAWERFFARRCPHLAGMIAYFGVLSIIPAAFLFLSALAITGALDNQEWIVQQLEFAIPEQGADTILRTVENLRENSGSLGIVGFIGLVWGTSTFFSCIESALNIIYGVNHRHFIFQKAWVLFLMLAALVAMVAVTLAVAVALPILERIEHSLDLPIEDSLVSVGLSILFAFLFFLSCFRSLPNISVSTREVWRGAVIAAAAFELSIQVLPAWIGENRGGVVISAFAGAFIVLIWFYLMAFVLLVGGVYNWWYREKRRLEAARRVAPAASS